MRLPWGGGSVTLTLTPLTIPAQSAVTADLYGDSLTVTTDAIGDSPHTISLSETAEGGILSISRQSLDFGSALAGGIASFQYSVTNSGNAPVTLSYTGQSFPSIFAMPSTVIAGGSVATPIATFLPQFAMSYGDVASLHVDGVLCQPLPFTTSSLSGTGTGGSLVSVSASSLSFGNNGLVACGTTAAPQTVTVTNSSASPITVTAALGLAGNSAFAVALSNGGVAPSGGSVTVTLTPKPIPAVSSTQSDKYADTLTLTTTAPGDSPHLVQLHETAQGAIFAFNRQALNLPRTKVGSSTTSGGNFRVLNGGNVSADFSLNNSDPTNYGIAPGLTGTASSTLGAAFASAFHPMSLGKKTATVTITPANGVVLCGPLPAGMTMTGTGN